MLYVCELPLEGLVLECAQWEVTDRALVGVHELSEADKRVLVEVLNAVGRHELPSGRHPVARLGWNSRLDSLHMTVSTPWKDGSSGCAALERLVSDLTGELPWLFAIRLGWEYGEWRKQEWKDFRHEKTRKGSDSRQPTLFEGFGE